VGELNAKDAAQETVIGLLGMLAGSFIIQHITTRSATWISLIALLFLHLLTNYLAVRSVVMTSLNRQRLTIAYTSYRADGKIPTPADVSQREQILDFRGGLADYGGPCGTCCIESDGSNLVTAAQEEPGVRWDELCRIHEREKFILGPNRTSARNRKPQSACIYFKTGWTPRDSLSAWIYALEFLRIQTPASPSGRVVFNQSIDTLGESLVASRETVSKFVDGLQEAGWNLENTCIVTESISTVDIELLDKKEQ